MEKTNASIELPPEAQRHLADDEVAWLTTVTDSGAPAPNPVWFVVEGDDIVVFSMPTAHKVKNITQRPTVTLHFNSDEHGGDFAVITGTATVTPDVLPSSIPAYIDKYEAAITGALGMTVEQIDAEYNTEIRIRPTRARGTAADPA